MHIKVGDIVRYGGVNQRIMMRGQYISRLSTYGVIDNSLCHLDLVESMTLPHLEVGDWVLINNIPIQEKNAYQHHGMVDARKSSHLGIPTK